MDATLGCEKRGHVSPVRAPSPATAADLRSRESRSGQGQGLPTVAVLVGVSVIAIERLDFADIRTLGRQRGRRGKPGKTTRRKVCGIPTAKFSHTITSAAYRHNMTVIAVDPAYTSIWGARYWKKPLDRSRRQAGNRTPGSLCSHRQKKPGIRCKAKRQPEPSPTGGSVRESNCPAEHPVSM